MLHIRLSKREYDLVVRLAEKLDVNRCVALRLLVQKGGKALQDRQGSIEEARLGLC